MKFFNIIILESYCHNLYLNHLYDVPSILVPFHRLSRQYSMHHNLSPRNVFTNRFSSNEETQVVKCENSYPLIALQYRLHLSLSDTLYAYGHGLYLQLLSKFLYPRYYKLALTSLDSVFERLLPILYIDIWCTKSYEHLGCLLYGFQFYFPFAKNREIFRNYKSCTKVHSFD